MWAAFIFTIALFCSYATIKGLIGAFLVSSDDAVRKEKEYKTYENFILWFSIISCILWGVFYYITH